MVVLLNGFFICLIYFGLVVLLFGFLIALLNKTFYKLVNYNRFILYSTGLIGTPIHELSHLLVALIFGHKITEVSFFRISNDGVLGYVNHSYNKRNLWAQLGNYFIGIAPLISGAGLVYLVTYLLMPQSYGIISDSINTFVSHFEPQLSFSLINDIFGLGKDFVVAIANNITNIWLFILYIIIMLSLSLHMNLSNADIKGSLKGLPYFLLVVAILNVIFYFINYSGFLNTVVYLGTYMIATMVISLIFSLVLVSIAGIIRLLRKLIFKR